MSRAAKVFFKFLFGSGISILTSLLSGIIISRSIGPEGKGIIAELLVIPTLFVPFAELGLRQSGIFHTGENYNKNKLSTTILTISIISSVVMSLFVLLIFIINDDLAVFTGFQSLVIFLYIPIMGAIRPIFGVFLGENKTTLYNNYRWGPAAIKLAFILTFTLFLKLGVNEALFSMIIGEFILIIYGLYHLCNFAKISISNFDFKLAKSLVFKGVFFCLSFAVIKMNHRIDVFLLKEFSVKSTDIGYYINGVGIAELVWQIPTILGLIILSKVKKKNNKKFMIAKSLRFSNTIVFFSSIFIIIFCDFIITTLYGIDFRGSVIVTQYILIGVVLFNSFQILNSYYESSGQPLKILTFTFPALLINLTINLILIPKFGINGAVWSTNISYLVCSVLFTLRFSLKENIPLQDMLFLKKTEVIEIYHSVKLKLNR